QANPRMERNAAQAVAAPMVRKSRAAEPGLVAAILRLRPGVEVPDELDNRPRWQAVGLRPRMAHSADELRQGHRGQVRGSSDMIDLERQVLGVCLLDGKGYWRIADRLVPDDFADPDCRE